MSTSHQAVVIQTAADIVSAGTIVGAFLGYLPAIAALGAIIWYAIQIWESRPIQTFLRLHRHKKRRRKLGRPVEGAKVVHRRRRHAHASEPQ